MKRIMKFRRILQKSKHIKKDFSKKKISRKNKLKKKSLFQIIESPHNTNDFLINNRSSAFYMDEEEEDSIIFQSSPIILLEDDTNLEINLFDLKYSESTNEESVLINEKSEASKGQISQCFEGEKQ